MRFAMRLMTRFGRHSIAAAAVEFAIVFPFALLLYIGAAELSDAINVSRKVEIVSRTLVDLLSQQPTTAQATSFPSPLTAVSSSQLQTLMTSATGLLYPANTSPLKMTLSAIDITNNLAGVCCSILVRWSITQNGTLRPCVFQVTTTDPSAPPSRSTIPSTLIPVATGQHLPASISILVADVSYTYTPIFQSSYISFASGMSRTSYIYPRALGQVITQAPLPTSGAQTGLVCY